MKHTLTIILLLACALTQAQQYSARREKNKTEKAPEPTESDIAAAAAVQKCVESIGHYETKYVYAIPNTSADVLYSRAREALSDWTGPGGNSSAHLDYTDKDAGIVTFKGQFSLGVKNGGLFLASWRRCANFTFRVKCKDNRAQVLVTVPSITAYANKPQLVGPEGLTFTIGKALQQLDESHTSRKRDRITLLLADLYYGAESLAKAMQAHLAADDDF